MRKALKCNERKERTKKYNTTHRYSQQHTIRTTHNNNNIPEYKYRINLLNFICSTIEVGRLGIYYSILHSIPCALNRKYVHICTVRTLTKNYFIRHVFLTV